MFQTLGTQGTVIQTVNGRLVLTLYIIYWFYIREEKDENFFSRSYTVNVVVRGNGDIKSSTQVKTLYVQHSHRQTHTYGAACCSSLGRAQPDHVCVKHIHFLHQTAEGRLCCFPDLLIHTLSLEQNNKHTHSSKVMGCCLTTLQTSLELYLSAFLHFSPH